MNAQRLLVDQEVVPKRPPAPRRREQVVGDESTGGHSASSRQRILDYLAAEGGSVQSSDGRGLTRTMARSVGYEDLSTLNAMLTRLEREGAIVRDVRGRRTYRIALGSDGSQGKRKRGRPGPASRSKQAEVQEELFHPRGHLRFCLLLLVAERPGHGYDLVERLRPFGYEHDDPAQTYRALHWLEGAGLVRPTWETTGPGPARRVFSVTAAGQRIVEQGAATLRQRTRNLEAHLDQQQAKRLEVVSEPQGIFRVLVEAKLSVDAADEATARRKVEQAFADHRMVDAGVRATGEVWLYEATQENDQG